MKAFAYAIGLVLTPIFITLTGGAAPFPLLAPAAAPTKGHQLENDQLSVALARVDASLRQDLAELEGYLADYARLAATTDSSPEKLRRTHREARLAYKRVEYLLAYAEPATVSRHLNGAPLPKLEPSVPEVVILPPAGLQALDELVYTDAPDRSAMKRLTSQLLGDYRRLHGQLGTLTLQHRHVFEAMRQEVILLYTLGVTGFDTPASPFAALPETRQSLATLRTNYGHYSTILRDRDSALDRTITEAFERGIAALEAGEFETFDRLEFLREVINPLTAGLPAAQRLLQIESSGDNPRLPNPVNYRAETLFDANFLNADYYANLNDVSTNAERLALGRLLFFDPVLSKDLTLSCASCHRPELAFTDGYAKSPTADGKGTVLRNSPTLVGSVYAEKYFYDLREEFLERQVKHVVMDNHEFATDFVTLEERLRQSDKYVQLFQDAYQQQPQYALSKWSISDALARYVASLRGNNSAFDRYARGDSDALSEEVRAGYNLFMGKAACGTCHFAPTFSGLVPPYYAESESEVLGVPAAAVWSGASVDPDRGRGGNSRPEDEAYFNIYAFKTPTVRNAAVTAPYMHNGVYASLNEVMDFYNRGGGAGIGINLPHQTLPTDPLELDKEEIDRVIAFLESLTDYRDLVEEVPEELPAFTGRAEWNQRRLRGRK